MLISEILSLPVTEARVVSMLQTFNWLAEYSDNDRESARAPRDGAALETALYEFWKLKPARMLELWERYSPGAQAGRVPSFIERRAFEESQT